MISLAMAATALLLEGFVGYPAYLQHRLGHPVQGMGALITYLDEGLNDSGASVGQNRINGTIALIALLIACVAPTILLVALLARLPFGWIINILLATSLLAQKSLADHVRAVAEALPRSLPQARLEVSKIVGRDPSDLNQSGIAKAALETLAENASDGVVAPFIWYALLGLPGLVAYKAINTADSMIGHKSEKYLGFGWAAARLDDLVNLPASRLTGHLLTGAAAVTSTTAVKAAWAAMWRDAAKHHSPNAGWPEAAMAGALGLHFGGPRSYDGQTVGLATIGDGRPPQGEKDIEAGLFLYRNAMALLFLTSVILAMVL